MKAISPPQSAKGVIHRPAARTAGKPTQTSAELRESVGEFYPLRIPPYGMAAVSPRDKSRIDGALSPVAPEKASSLNPHGEAT